MFDQALLDSSPLHTPVLKTCHRTASLLAGIAASLAAFSWIHGTSASFELREVLARAILIGAAAGSFSLMVCCIYADARVQNLRLVSGHPLLIEAAKKAVARWRYQPTLLNGEAVDVVTEIDVNFTLAE